MSIMPNPPAERGALSISEAARWLGISTTAMYELIACGELPAARIGAGRGRHVVPMAALRKYLSDRTEPA